MKNKLLIVVVFLLFCFIPLKVDAASIKVSASRASAVVGGNVTVNVTLSESKGLGSWEFSVSYDSDKLQLVSGNAHVIDYVQGPGQNSKTYSYTFRVKKSGSATVSVVNTSVAAWDETTSSPTGSTAIKCLSQEDVAASYSKNNNLKSLSVEGYDIAFQKDTLNYDLEVENDVTKIVVKAEAEDSKARISGAGEIEVHEGANTIEIVVTAENGSSKTYKLQVNVKELNPIEVALDEKKYTVVRKVDELKDKLLPHFEQTTIKIGEEEVLAFTNSVIDVSIVALKDEDGNISYYQYLDGKYIIYKQITSGNLTIWLLDKDKKIPKGYKEYKIKVGDQEISIYKLKKSSDFGLVYGQNVETGKKDIYSYDEIENTLQRYNVDEMTKIQNTSQEKTYIILGLISLIVILLVILLVLLRNKKSVKKKQKKTTESKEFLK